MDLRRVRAAVRGIPAAAFARATRALGVDRDPPDGSQQAQLLLYGWLRHLSVLSDDECLEATRASVEWCGALADERPLLLWSLWDYRWAVWSGRDRFLDLKTGDLVVVRPQAVTLTTLYGDDLLARYAADLQGAST